MDYRTTLNLPKTAFPMRANLPEAEPKVLARWETEKLYERLLKRRHGEPSFILHDGPPYANGDIHIGHALNKILKDIVVRFEMLQGRFVPFVPGWDCHGLPIEYQLMKELNVTKHQVDTVEFRKKARAYALKYVGVQRDQFKRLGCLGDWENPYLTLEPGYVASALRALARLVSRGFIYRARRPVNWCWVCETALAEAEVEYETHASPSIYVKLKVDAKAFGIDLPAYLVIWTTTPWTLMGNVAVAVNPSLEYAIRKKNGEAWITLLHLPQGVDQVLGLTGPSLLTVRGSRLEGLRYRHPFGFREGQVVLADYVTTEGIVTGLVHIAPGFGEEDYFTGKKYNLEVLAPVDTQGKFSGLPKPVQQFNGQQVQEANKDIVELLDKNGALVWAGELEHTYPHCWRCHTPIIFRATDQWFLDVEKEGLRQRLLDLAQNQVRWVPSEGRERMAGMLKSRPDWCLSRQRLWGIPIPAVLCGDCGEGILDPRVIEAFARAIEQDPEGSDRWSKEPVDRWLPPGFTCPRCNSKSFKAGTDILDVWFDSGVSHQAVLTRRTPLGFPADLYLEGSDQHRGWFQVSLITSVALEGKAPYRGVLTHGFVVDGQGRKMSKSLGNVIAPQEVVSQMGADVLRLWVASSDYSEDVRISPQILDQVAEVYRKIRNTLRFCLANLGDFPWPAKGPVLSESLKGPESVEGQGSLQGRGSVEGGGVLGGGGSHEGQGSLEDQESRKGQESHEGPESLKGPGSSETLESFEGWNRWVLFKLADLSRTVTQAYQQYAFHRVVKAIHEFCTVELSNFYLDIVKDRLYASHPEDPKRRQIQASLAILADHLIRLLAPILPMTAEEAWACFPGSRGKGSVHAQDWPTPPAVPVKPQDREGWDRLLQWRDQAMKALERSREGGLIGDALEAHLEVVVRDPALWEFLNSRREELLEACIVSGLNIEKRNEAGPPVSISVRKAAGAKCQRCWMRLPTVGESTQHPTLCHRCVEVL